MSVWSKPRTIDEALKTLEADPKTVVIAGGTDWMVTDALSRRAAQGAMSIRSIADLRGIRDEDGLRIGAATTFTEIGASPLVRDAFPALAAAAGVVGGWQIQNRATIAGNVVNASPAGDSLPVLLALDAEIEIASTSGVRRVPYADFMTGYRETVLKPGELVTAIHLPKARAGSTQVFQKVGTRTSQAISKVVVAVSCRLKGDVLTDVRVGIGSVAATPVRLFGVETYCEGRSLTAETAREAGEIAEGEVHPIDDVRSTADYRRHVTGRVIRRIFESRIAPGG